MAFATGNFNNDSYKVIDTSCHGAEYGTSSAQVEGSAHLRAVTSREAFVPQEAAEVI